MKRLKILLKNGTCVNSCILDTGEENREIQDMYSNLNENKFIQIYEERGNVAYISVDAIVIIMVEVLAEENCDKERN